MKHKLMKHPVLVGVAAAATVAAGSTAGVLAAWGGGRPAHARTTAASGTGTTARPGQVMPASVTTKTLQQNRAAQVFSAANCPTHLPAGPSWLPAAVAGPAQAQCAYGDINLVWHLKGLANQNTMPAGGGATFDGSQHPATVVTLGIVPDALGTIPAQVGDPAYDNLSIMTMSGGRRAQLTTSKGGSGVTRIVWVQNQKLYSLIGSRGTTTTGPSGLTATQLEKMAASIRG